MIAYTPSNLANAVAPFNPLGRQPVGEETGENRNTPLAPVVEAAEAERDENQRTPGERRGEVDQRVALEGRQQDGQQGETASDDGLEGDRDNEAQRQETQQRQRERQEQQQLLEDQQRVRQLVERDSEVRSHEQAHTTSGGDLAGAASFTYERGPDGNSYAVSGEVPISLGKVAGNPEQTLANAQQVQRAALAPTEPSSQDRRVASAAASIELEAQQDIVRLASEAQARREADAGAAREERKLDDEQREQAQTSDQAIRQRQASERAEQQSSAGNRNVDLTQRLLDIGVAQAGVSVGDLLNQEA